MLNKAYGIAGPCNLWRRCRSE